MSVGLPNTTLSLVSLQDNTVIGQTTLAVFPASFSSFGLTYSPVTNQVLTWQEQKPFTPGLWILVGINTQTCMLKSCYSNTHSLLLIGAQTVIGSWALESSFLPYIIRASPSESILYTVTEPFLGENPPYIIVAVHDLIKLTPLSMVKFNITDDFKMYSAEVNFITGDIYAVICTHNCDFLSSPATQLVRLDMKTGQMVQVQKIPPGVTYASAYDSDSNTYFAPSWNDTLIAIDTDTASSTSYEFVSDPGCWECFFIET